MKRKIIQICTGFQGEQFEVPLAILALCNDNTVWVMDKTYSNWNKLPDIPQDKNKENKK